MAEKIQAYKPVCCNKAFLYKSSAERHEKRCPHNPQNKACQTCLHKIMLSETFYNPYHNGNPGSTDYDVPYWFCDVYEKEISKYEDDGKTISLKMNCEKWEEAKEDGKYENWVD